MILKVRHCGCILYICHASAWTSCMHFPNSMMACSRPKMHVSLGIQVSVLVRLSQRGRVEGMSGSVYRIAHFPADQLAQYRETILWAQVSHGPERVALSHETALLLYGISDVN